MVAAVVPRAEVQVGGIAPYIAAAYHFTTKQSVSRRKKAEEAEAREKAKK